MLTVKPLKLGIETGDSVYVYIKTYLVEASNPNMINNLMAMIGSNFYADKLDTEKVRNKVVYTARINAKKPTITAISNLIEAIKMLNGSFVINKTELIDNKIQLSNGDLVKGNMMEMITDTTLYALDWIAKTSNSSGVIKSKTKTIKTNMIVNMNNNLINIM